MKGIFYDLKIRKALLKKMGIARRYSMIKYRDDWPIPEISHPNQVMIKTLLGGICAGDLHQINVTLPFCATIIARKDNPFQMGHELVGEVVKIGEGVKNIKIGDHVTFSPIINCEAYGFEPCPSCREGHYNTCQANAGIGDGSGLEETYGGEGGFGGFSGGGFSEFFVAFERQLTPVSKEIPDEITVLAEPFSIGIHAALRKLPRDDETALIIGGGIISLMTIAAIRALNSKCRVIALVRYPFQASMAKQLGADDVILERDTDAIYSKVAQLTNAALVKPLRGKRIIYGRGGPDIIFDAIGTDSTIDDSLRLIRCNGTIVLIGMAFGTTKKTEWALQIYKEISILGSMNSGLEEFNGEKVDAFELAARFLEKEPHKYKGLVTHQFQIEDYKQAFSLAMNKSRDGAIKIAFSFKIS
ncbi:MAG: zinc-binding dehydrogenase [Candidatus Thorarchaeota archaeon]